MTPGLSLAALAVFAGVFGAAAASPGPTVAALLARVLARGRRGILPFCLGLVAGDLLWLGAAVLGLGMVVTLFQPVFVALKYLGAAYLLFLAWKLWTSPVAAVADIAPPRGEGARLFLGAIAVVSGNPKTMLFYFALLPTVLPLGRIAPADFAVLAAAVVVVYGAILVAYVLAADRARRAFTSVAARRRINRATGAVMAGAAVAVASRS
jgi:threonine/homoserine/homoserine lactone efflux protein